MEVLPFFSCNRQFLKSHDLKFFGERHKNEKQKSFFLAILPRKICENENSNVRLLKLNGLKFEGAYRQTGCAIWNPTKLNGYPWKSEKKMIEKWMYTGFSDTKNKATVPVYFCGIPFGTPCT